MTLIQYIDRYCLVLTALFQSTLVLCCSRYRSENTHSKAMRSEDVKKGIMAIVSDAVKKATAVPTAVDKDGTASFFPAIRPFITPFITTFTIIMGSFQITGVFFLTDIQWATLIYLLGYKISVTRGFLVPKFPKKIKIKTKIIGYRKTSGKLIL